MRQNIDSNLSGSSVENYVGGNEYNYNNYYYSSAYQESERAFVITHNVNIKPVSYFIGRETELQELCQRIEEGRKSVLVSGMGGIGKTHICRKLFEEYQTKNSKGENRSFSHIGYIEYNGDMNSSLQECLVYQRQEDPELDKEAAWKELEYLASDGKLLLFVDNVNVSIGADPGLKRLKNIPGAIVLTSRRTSFSREFELIRIGFLDTEQCRKIYEKIRFEEKGIGIKAEEIPILDDIIEKLAARHTITVEHLAHLALTKGWSVKTLQNQLQSSGFQLEYVNEEEELINIQKSYEALYDLSQLTNAEQNILEAFSVFPYIPLEKELCKQWLLADAAVNEDDNVLFRLYQKGWLQSNAEHDSYALHPVFAQFIHQKCKPSLEEHRGLIEECRKCLKIPESGSILGCQKFIPFAESILEKVDMGECEKQISFLFSLGDLLQEIAEYEKAKERYKKALKLCRELLGEEHLVTARSYHNLALLYKKQGEYKKAEELYIKSLRIQEKLLGEEHLNTATSYNNLGVLYKRQGDYKKAKELYEKSLKILKKVLGENHPETARTYNNLGVLYKQQREYAKAEELYIKSQRIYEKTLGEEHPNTARSYNILGKLYVEQGEYAKAKELYERSLPIREKVLGEEHPDTATSYNDLAVLYKKQGKYAKAEELYRKSLRIREKVLGEDHPATATSYHNLAEMYEEQGEYAKAEELYRKSLSIREKMLGDYHPETARSYNNLAVLYFRQEEYEISLTYCMKAYKIFVFKLGADHPDTKVIYSNMETVYKKLNPEGNFEQWLEEKMKK